MIIATILKFSKFSTQYDRILKFISMYIVLTFLKILSLWASTYSCWTRWPFPLVGGVDLWRSWFTWFSYFWLLLLLLCGGVRLDEGSSRLKAEGGTHFLKNHKKKLVKSICTSFHTYISMGRKSKKSPGQKIPETKSINFTEICFLIFSTKFWDE